MALNYDFDMISPMAGANPGDHGDRFPPGGTPVALFRDPDTVEALTRAPEAVQDYLRASHFGINTYHSGAPAGRYPEADDAARIEVIEALAENVRKFDLPRSDDGQPAQGAFHLPSFFAAVAEAEPIAMPAPVVAEVLPDVAPAVEAAEPMLFAACDLLTEEAPAVDEAAPEAQPVAFAVDTPPEQAPAVEEAVPGAEPMLFAPDDTLCEAEGPAHAEDFISQMMLAEAEIPAETPAAAEPEPEAEAGPARAPILLLQNRIFEEAAPEETDSLIAGMMAGSGPADESEEALPADIMVLSGTEAAPESAVGSEPELPPAAVVAKRGFRLPSLPRWMTATAAFVMLGVAVGTAMI